MEYLFDQTAVTFIDAPADVDHRFMYDGRTYETVGQAYHSCRPNGELQTFQSNLVCLDDGAFAGYLVYDVINENCDDQADACNWDKFDVYQI